MTLRTSEERAPTSDPSADGDAGEARPTGFATRVSWAVLLAVQSILARCPLRAALWIGRRLGEVAYYVVYPRTRVALEQLAWAMPELSPRRRRATVREMYRQFGQGAAEVFLLPRMIARGELDRIVTVEGEQIVRDAFAQGRGLLILTAHYGNFELLATFFAARGYQVNLVTRKLRNGVLDRFWAEQRRQLRVRAIFKDQSLKEVIGRLRKNEAMGYVLDQNMGIDQGVFVEFFGRPACTLNVVAVLARRFGSPVVPVFISRDKKDPTRHHIVFDPPLAFESRAGADAEGAAEAELLENTQRYTAVIERRVRERPDHWIWIHKRWKTRPRPSAA